MGQNRFIRSAARTRGAAPRRGRQRWSRAPSWSRCQWRATDGPDRERGSSSRPTYL